MVGPGKKPCHKFDRKPSEVAFSAAFSSFDKCRLEVASDVISGVAVQLVGLDVRENVVILCQTVLEIYESLAL